MRRIYTTVVLAGALLAGGCSDKEIHIDKVRTAFQGMAPDQRVKLDAGLKELESSNYTAALPKLQSFAFGTKMNEEQRKVLADTIAKVSEKAQK